MRNIEKEIIKIIESNPGIKTIEIAKLASYEQKLVISVLNNLRNFCYQDSNYRWYLKTQKSNKNTIKKDFQPDKKLSDICKYYLNCLSLESNTGISDFLVSKEEKYAELSSLSIENPDERVLNLIRKVSIDKRLIAHLGYPVLIKSFYSKSNKHSLKITPVFLFPVEIINGKVSVSSIPYVNMEVIKQYSERDINMVAYDLIQIEEELGLNSLEEDIDLYEVVSRLQAIRSWQWKDELDPSLINKIPSVKELTEDGIYNKAIFIVSERSPYTIGLESELSYLSQLDEDSYKNTALYDWIHTNVSDTLNVSFDSLPLLEVLPVNSEQEQAIYRSMNNKLTVVTGPPGTGKSQVVTSLLINSVWNGQGALFTSKNNNAVDVVEERINSLGKKPIILRIGGNQYAYRLAQLISNLICSSSDEYDYQEYQRYLSLYEEKIYSYKSLKSEKEEVLKLRNNVDRMDRKLCELSEKWHKWSNKINENDIVEFELELNEYYKVYEDWYKTKNSLLGKLFWILIGKNKTTKLEKSLENLNEQFIKYEESIICKNLDFLDNNIHKKIYYNGGKILDILKTINEYDKLMSNLSMVTSFEDIDRGIIKIKIDIANVSSNLWNGWLMNRSLSIDSYTKREMHEYVSAIKLIKDIDLSEHPDIRKRFYNLQKKMTKFLPCWAVTSLSAKGKVPLQPGMFDLVVIDEASQCDIASALPMLYRAKRAVIIGDPKQLSHISTISKGQDINLLKKFNVDMGWSYSCNSLYEKASSLTKLNQVIHLRDHHRSFADIIEFSNAEFYDGKLRIATNYDRLRTPKNISAGVYWNDTVGETIRPSSGSAYNDQEVYAIVEELKKIVIKNEYKGSIGVVTPFKEQAKRIDDSIRTDTELNSALIKNDFLVSTVHKFQGDERDLIIFSPVISKGTVQSSLSFLINTANLFNVAITRARAVLIVIGDKSFCSKCGVSYLENFVLYINSIKNGADKESVKFKENAFNDKYPKVQNSDQVSEWEKTFYEALYDQGIITIPQYSVDKYKLDLAIIDGNRKLDIEIDGEMYHQDWNGELCYRDQLRNQRLFELGWDVKRFWVYQIRDDLQGCVSQVRNWLNNK